MTITGIMGAIGAGKSWYQLKRGLEMAEQRKKKLVTNFGLDFKALELYCALNNLPWCQWLAQERQIAVIDTAESLQDLLIYPASVVLLDEAGIFLNVREFRATPKKLLQDLAQSRKEGQDLIYAAQFDEQVDRQFRDLTQYYVQAAGLSRYDRKLRGPRLHWKQYHLFTADNYKVWKDNNQARAGFFSTKHLALKSEVGLFTSKDATLFDCFDSFTRLEEQASAACTFEEKCHYSVAEAIRDTQRAARQRRSAQALLSDHNQLLMSNVKEVLSALKAARRIPKT
jgi:hypothetical protein